MVKQKKRLGIFSLTSCDGCQITFLDMDEDFLELLDNFDMIDFPLIKDGTNLFEEVDIAFVEGTPVNDEEINTLKKIRKLSKKLVAFGTCATFGGVTAIKDFSDDKLKKEIKKDNGYLKLHDNIKGIGDIVKVDAYIRGCPPTKSEIKNLLQSFLNDKEVIDGKSPVCVECRKNGNPCFLKEGIACMGSITYSGCNSICINNKFPCYGCRGPIEQANADSLFLVLKNKVGMSEKEVKNMFMLYAGTNKRYSKIMKNG